MTEPTSQSKFRCMTCKNRERNANDDEYCHVKNDFIDVFEMDFVDVVGCASHSDLVDSVEKCPDRVVEALGIAACKNYRGCSVPYICSAKRYHELCPRGFSGDEGK